jgi:hypothetical protein
VLWVELGIEGVKNGKREKIRRENKKLNTNKEDGQFVLKNLCFSFRAS